MFDWLKSKLEREQRERLYPESLYVVTVSSTEVSCQKPDGRIETIAWDDLQAVVVETNDTGPWWTDIWWILSGTQSWCVVPQGATGEDELIEKLQTLPGFEIKGMNSTENRRFVCWQAKPD